METGIHIGAEISKESAENLRKIIEAIFRVGYQTHMDQRTIRAALKTVSGSLSVNGTTVTGSSITGDKVVNL
jgi:hypothetical protein